MRRHNYRLWKLAIFSMLAVISVMGFGYSLLSSNLAVSSASVVNQHPLTWDVGFNGTYSATALNTGASSVSCGDPLMSSTSAQLRTTHLSASGDGCRYELEVENSGDIGAKINAVDTVVDSNSSGYTCTRVSSGQVLSCTKSGDSSEILVFPSKSSSITASTLGSSTASSIATSYVSPLLNTTLNSSSTHNIYLYVFLRGTPNSTSFSGLSFTTTVGYTQN